MEHTEEEIKSRDDGLIQQYLESLTDVEKKACKIAREHLLTSFNILKSNGFVEWLKEKQPN